MIQACFEGDITYHIHNIRISQQLMWKNTLFCFSTYKEKMLLFPSDLSNSKEPIFSNLKNYKETCVIASKRGKIYTKIYYNIVFQIFP